MKAPGSFRRAAQVIAAFLTPGPEHSVSCRRCGIPLAMEARLRGRAAREGRERPDGSRVQHAAAAATAYGGLCDRCLGETGVLVRTPRSRRLTRPTKVGRRKAIAYARRYRDAHNATAPAIAAAVARRESRIRAKS